MWMPLALMLLGLFNLSGLISKNHFWKGQIIRLLIGGPLAFCWSYFMLPAYVPRIGWRVITVTLLLNGIITLLEGIAKRSRTGIRLGSLLLAVVFITQLVIGVIIPYGNAQRLQQLPNVQISEDKIEAINVEHIRLVPYRNAFWKAQKVIGNLGNTYEIGPLFIQKSNDHLYWVTALEFRGFFKWREAGVSPGYIIIDAEDAEAPAELHTGYQLKYTPSAFFSNDLNRHVYRQYPNDYLTEASLEIDDAMKPWYVMSLTQPTIGSRGEQISGVVLIDPQSGELFEYSMDAVPEWVDQVVPETLAETYNVWYGKYKHGFWNSLFAQKDVHLPTEWQDEPDVFGVIGADDHFYWFTGHTSPSANDDSLVGYMMMDAKSGEMFYYPHANGYYNEQAAVSTISNAVSNYSGWYGAQPIFYNIYGVETWIVPVLAANNNLQAIGIVHAKTGYSVVRENKKEALFAYKQYLAQEEDDYIPSQEQKTLQITGYIDRIEHIVDNGQTTIYLKLKNMDMIYSGKGTLHPELIISREWDKVNIDYLDTGDVVKDIIGFDNLELLNPQQ